MHLLNISIFLDVPTYSGDRCNTKMKKFLQDCSIQQGYRSATSLPPLPPGEGWGEGINRATAYKLDPPILGLFGNCSCVFQIFRRDEDNGFNLDPLSLALSLWERGCIY